MPPFARIPSAIALAIAACLGTPSFAAENPPATGCSAFTWNVKRELELMAQPAAAIDAAKNIATPARIELDKHYLAHLSPQKDVQLPAKPGKPMLDDGAQAGLLSFRVPKTGQYRVAISSGHWIDVVDDGRVIPSIDFQGQRGCDLAHKIVQFDLPAGHDLVLQFSGGTTAQVGVTIVAAAAPLP